MAGGMAVEETYLIPALSAFVTVISALVLLSYLREIKKWNQSVYYRGHHGSPGYYRKKIGIAACGLVIGIVGLVTCLLGYIK